MSKKTLTWTTAALGVLWLACPARAQNVESELAPERVTPGWVFTPSMALGMSYDDNPLLASQGNPSPNDTVGVVRPGLNLSFNQKHTHLGAAYHGSLIRYRDFTQFDTYGQRGTLDFRHQPTKHLRFYARDSFMATPTTDAIQVSGVPFYRTGTRHNEFEGGMGVTPTEHLEITGAYRFQWLEFDRPDTIVGALLQGGRSHGAAVQVRQQVSPRWKVGADWDFRHSTLQGSAEAFDIQNATAVAEWQASPTVTIEGGAGVSHLSLPAPLGSETGPAVHVSARKQTEYAAFSLSAMRSFVPSFSFGGSLRNQEVSAGVYVPFGARRGYVHGSAAWRDSEPVLQQELGLRALWLDTTVGYMLRRWLSVEGYYVGAFQDTTVAGGRVDRNRVGVQIVTSHPVRFD